jgi:2-polyprenyl-3-methyl-5-hydroxy-6-metoxy-1,4-benzoquinol methylase
MCKKLDVPTIVNLRTPAHQSELAGMNMTPNLNPSWNCGCCGSTDLRLLCSMPNYEAQLTSLAICNLCGAVTPEHVQNDSRATTTMQTDYHEALWGASSDQELMQLAHDMRQMVEFYQPILGPPGDQKTIVEIGAGRGNLTASLAMCGYNVRSCDPSAHLVDLARRVYQLTKSQLTCAEGIPFLAALADEGAQVQAVFLWHVIEHVDDPFDMIAHAKRIVGNNGAIVFQAPTPAPHYIYPEHRFFATREWVHRTAERFGLRTLQCDFLPFEQFISFAFCSPAADLNLPGFDSPAVPQGDVLSDWVTELSEGLRSAQHVYRDQAALIDARDNQIITITEQLATADQTCTDLQQQLSAIQAWRNAFPDIKSEESEF